MSVDTQLAKASAVIYPESDGQPMADNTKQFRIIVMIQGGLDAMFAADPNVFVAGDLLWYPVEGEPGIRRAPDAMVAFGRPKGDRGSYLQWNEGGIAPQVVFEVLSPGNTLTEMTQKLEFYERYGVEEYYLYDPDHNELRGWQRRNGRLEGIAAMQGWISPRLGIHFVLTQDELAIYRPDGERFLTYVELEQQRMRERLAREAAQQQADRERLAREAAQQQADRERLAREAADQRAEQLAARLRALGIDPDA